MPSFKKSLIFNLGTVVFLVEFLVLSSLGLFYTDRFSTEVDRRLEEKVALPGALMNHQLLRYESVSDKTVMIDLVGEEFMDGFIVGADGRIYYSFDPELVGESFYNIPGLDNQLLTSPTDAPKILHDLESSPHTIISITPIVAYDGAKPFFHVYIKAGTQEATNRKLRIAGLFVFGSALCIILTSLAIIGYSRQNVTMPLTKLAESADALRQGDLDIHIPVEQKNEIGRLGENFVAMRDAIKQQIGALEMANRNLEERESKLKALIETFPDRIIVFDYNGTYLEIFAQDKSLLFLTEDELLGKRIHDVRPNTDADVFLSIIRKAIETGESQTFEYTLKVPAGDVWFESRASRIGTDSGSTGKVLWVVRDITYRKAMEEQLLSAKNDAERVNQRLRELDQVKSALVSSVSHELRTPLTSLLGFSKLILKNFSKHFWPLAKGDHKLLTKGSQVIENLNILIHEGNRLTRLINDVLDLNKIEMGYANWREEAINPGELVIQAANAMRGQINSRSSLYLTTEIGENLPVLTADPDRMLQVLLNLLTNAAKFTPAGTITVRTYAPSAAVIRFEVADTGPGIPSQEQERIFDIFHQVTEYGPDDDKPRGAGLGLAICREIVQHYHGHIWVDSTPGVGSTFTVDIPIS